MKRQASRNSASRRYHINVRVAVILAGESDPFAVRRKRRVGFYADSRGKPRCLASFAPHSPQVAGVRKDDLGAAEGRLLQEEVVLGKYFTRCNKDCEEQQRAGYELHILDYSLCPKALSPGSG